ncbi:two-component system response regulator YesN [Aequitasia blattaphilus]|uniref:Stage 0 sporulation protein A homolog n=1 Tax=Aequitasia blattaphilus TaxID=2949332 RepID=A0ABT1ECU6_9FIRM|nr:response regulator [Aequitasia blattaphilus]MCP1103663.1 response regulator [Aequitasia blattaphilus]MCR8616303.1 response regulator [Aequitasia blattaphilus]
MYTVIIADDEYELRKALIDSIDWNKLGFEVVGEAENGAVALEMVELLQPDLLITDIRMPFVSGIELARQAREIRPYMHIVFISGFDDFSYAQKAIQYNVLSYLLKPLSSKEITAELVEIRKKIDLRFEELKGYRQEYQVNQVNQLQMTEFLMSQLFDRTISTSGRMEENDIIDEAVDLKLLHSTAKDIHFQVCVLMLTNSNKENVTELKHLDFVHGIFKKYLTYGVVYSKHKLIVVATGTRKDLSKFMHLVTTECVQTAKRVLKLDCIMGVSNMYNDWIILSTIYEEALSMLRYTDEDGRVQYASDITTTSQEVLTEVTDETIEKLDHLIKTGAADEIEIYLNSISQSIDMKENNNLDLFLIHLYATVCKSVTEITGGAEAAQFLSHIYIWDNETVHKFNEPIWEQIKKVCIEARNIIADQRRENSEMLTQKALDLIKNNYHDEEMSISKASQILHISSSYLSAVIKKNTGKTFGNLLTEERMKKAREYLLVSSMKVLEIAEKCGYSDTRYFSYCVKRYYGESPNRLRELGKNR